jgi:acetoin utilization protein AcuB
MFVSMWMTREVTTIAPTATLAEIATLMMRQRIRRLPVIGERGVLLGIVTHSDVLHAFPPDINPFAINAAESIAAITAAADRVRLTASDLMARDPHTTTPDAPVESAARLMRDHKIGALPVLSNHALVGLITESDIFDAMVEVFETRDRAVRVTFSLKPGEDVLPLVADIARRRALRVTSFMSLPQHEPPVCVVQLAGAQLDAALEDVWKSQHRVINVVQLNASGETPPARKPA